MGDKAREGRALICLGMDARLHGDMERSRPALERATTCLREGGLIGEAAACLMTLSLTLSDLGEFEPAFDAVTEAVKLSRQIGNKRLEGVALRRVAIVLIDQRRFAEAVPYAEGALALHREVGEPVEECHAHNVLGIAKAYLGRGGEAEAHWRTGLPLADAAESAVAGLYCLGNMAYAHFAWRGEYLAGISLIEDQLRRRYLGENAATATELRFFIADLTFTLGLYEKALAMMPELLASSASLLAQGIVVPATHSRRAAMYGKMLAEAGEVDEARRQLAAARPETLSEAALPKHATTLLYWACGVLALGDPGLIHEAIELTEQAAVRLGRAAPWNYDVAWAHRLLAELYLALGDFARGLQHAEQALEIQGFRQQSIECLYLTLARSLRGGEPCARGGGCHSAAYQRVLLVAGRTPDPDVQAAWLERVPANREIIAWWEAINQPDPLPATNPA